MRERTPRVATALAVSLTVLLAAWLRLARAPTEPIWDGWRYQQAAEALWHGEILIWNHLGMALAAAPLVPFFGARAAWAVSMAAGVAGVVAAHVFVARAARSRLAGVAAALLLATTPVHLYWSGTGHSGTLALLLAFLVGIAMQRGRGALALVLFLAGAAVRPDFVLLAPFFLAFSALDAGVPRSAARPLLYALPVLAVLAVAYLVAHGGRPDRFAWSVPEEALPAHWDARAHRKADGTLGLGPAAATWSPAYAPANLRFYGDVLADWVVRDWSGWVLWLPGNPLVTPIALAGAFLSRRVWLPLLFAVLLPFLPVFALYYGFSPEYALPLLVPGLACAGVAVARLACALESVRSGGAKRRSDEGRSGNPGLRASAAPPLRPERASAGASGASRPVPEAVSPPRRTLRRGPPMVFDRLKRLVRSDPPKAPSPRLALLVLLGATPESRADVALPRPTLVAQVTKASSEEAALRTLWTGRESGEGPSIEDVLRENGASASVLHAPPALARRAEAPPHDALLDAARAFEEKDARVLVAFARADGVGADRARAALDEALARIGAAATAEDWLAIAFLAADGTGELLVAGPGVAEGAQNLARVEWVDVAPTVYRALGAHVPEGLDGYALEEAFAAQGLSDADAKRVEEHLEKLGYL